LLRCCCRRLRLSAASPGARMQAMITAKQRRPQRRA
jgi:hypothetical protein